MQLKDSVVLVTGGAHRVGRSISTLLANKGANVVIHYRTRQSEAKTLCQEFRQKGRQSLAVQGNIESESDWHKMRDQILEEFGRLDVLVNNAAIFYKTPFENIRYQDWQNFLNVNLIGPALGCQVFGEVMKRQGSGKIINIADVSGETIWKDYIPYCTSKAGVLALTRGMAKALAPHVTVNAVSPGTVLLADEYDEEEEKHLIEKTPLKRVGAPEDIANTVAFLIEGSDFITGSVIKVDGGRSIV
ncbi:MAG: SDR family oxidoreductase [Calditrichia bacterium]